MLFSRRVLYIYMALVVIASLFLVVRFSLLIFGAPDEGVLEVRQRSVKVIRGSIYDRNGRLLANQIKLKSLEAWLPSIENIRRTAEIVGPVLDMDPGDLTERLVNNPRRYMWIKRFLSDREADELEGHIAKGELPGLRLRDEYRRYYPLGELGSHLLGFTNIDNEGLAGVERSMESWLVPEPNPDASPIQYGNKVFLSVDIDTQYIMDKIARKAVIENNADGVVALLMDARNGALLAYVSQPEYDPNFFNQYSAEIRRNKPIATAFEPGSVFKIYTMAAMLDEHVVSVDEIFDITTVYDPEVFKRNKIQPIRDVIPHGALSTTEVMIYSSNVGMATASERISREALYNKLRLFGFGNRTGIQLPGESNGILKRPSSWSVRTKPTISFGQEIGVSAIQMVTAATVFTNGGVLLSPMIIDRIEEPTGTVRLQNSRQVKYEVVSPVTARNMLLMMEQVVASPVGTMRNAKIDGLRISGKSGTSQVINESTGEYYEKRVNGSAIAIFPTEDPKFILYAIIFNPKGNVRFGGRLISPMVKEAIAELTTHYNLPLKGNRIAYFNESVQDLSSDELAKGEHARLSADIESIPDLKGYSKRQLLPLLQHLHLHLKIEGDGYVVEQSQAPGTKIPEDKEMSLTVWLK